MVLVWKQIFLIPHDLVNEHVFKVDQESVKADVFIGQLVEVVVEDNRAMAFSAGEGLQIVAEQVRLATLCRSSHEHHIASIDIGRIDILE